MSVEEFWKAAEVPLPQAEVKIPEWGGIVVRVRSLMADEKTAFEESRRVTDKAGKPTIDNSHFRSKLVCLAACRDNGEPMFKPDDYRRLGQLSAPGLERIVDAALRLNRMGEFAVEEAEKNSVPTPDASGS